MNETGISLNMLKDLSPFILFLWQLTYMGAQWVNGRVLDSRPHGSGFEPHWRHCVVSLSKNINPSLVLVQPRKTLPYITERLLMGRKKSNKTQLTYINHLCLLAKNMY